MLPQYTHMRLISNNIQHGRPQTVGPRPHNSCLKRRNLRAVNIKSYSKEIWERDACAFHLSCQISHGRMIFRTVFFLCSAQSATLTFSQPKAGSGDHKASPPVLWNRQKQLWFPLARRSPTSSAAASLTFTLLLSHTLGDFRWHQASTHEPLWFALFI